MAHERAGKPAQESDLIDVDAVLSAYHDISPDPSDPDHMVVFGTSGHRGSSLDGAFNDAHIAATTQAIVEYRTGQGTDGPLVLGPSIAEAWDDLYYLERAAEAQKPAVAKPAAKKPAPRKSDD